MEILKRHLTYFKQVKKLFFMAFSRFLYLEIFSVGDNNPFIDIAKISLVSLFFYINISSYY